MGKVYVVNYAGHNLEQAEKYGRLVYVTQGQVNVFSTDRLAGELETKLNEFDPLVDYLVLSGAIIINVIAYNFLKEKHKMPINVLMYNFNTKNYITRTI